MVECGGHQQGTARWFSSAIKAAHVEGVVRVVRARSSGGSARFRDAEVDQELTSRAASDHALVAGTAASTGRITFLALAGLKETALSVASNDLAGRTDVGMRPVVTLRTGAAQHTIAIGRGTCSAGQCDKRPSRTWRNPVPKQPAWTTATPIQTGVIASTQAQPPGNRTSGRECPGPAQREVPSGKARADSNCLSSHS